jgi:hypothetical protein
MSDRVLLNRHLLLIDCQGQRYNIQNPFAQLLNERPVFRYETRDLLHEAAFPILALPNYPPLPMAAHPIRLASHHHALPTKDTRKAPACQYPCHQMALSGLESGDMLLERPA